MKITKKLVLLQYPKVGGEGWYKRPIPPDEAETFVALDSASGGYPYSVHIANAHDFKTVEAAEKYRGHFAQFSVREVTVTYEF